MRATSDSWQHLSPPAQREPLGFEALFTDAEFERIALGLIPDQMEDKWFVYHEDDWLRFHRSWTGAFIYALRLERSFDGVRVVDSWVNRNKEQYNWSDTAYDCRLVRFLIDAFLLKKANVEFPLPPGLPPTPKGIVQHSLVGRGYPEKHGDGEA